VIFLADTRLVGKPDFHIARIDAFFLRDGLQAGEETFLNPRSRHRPADDGVGASRTGMVNLLVRHIESICTGRWALRAARGDGVV
jgi:hypothetical protein